MLLFRGVRMRFFKYLALAILWVFPQSVAAAAKPQRIVSLNPCVDAVLMRIADPGQIAAISQYSLDPQATSIPIEQASHFAATSGTAEEVLAKRPDLVIAGPHVALPTIHALQRLGIRLMQFNVPQSVSESRTQISEIAQAIGAPSRGARLNRSEEHTSELQSLMRISNAGLC